MKFYRLEKPNMFKKWAYLTFKGIVISLIVVLVSMLAADYRFMIVSSGSMEPMLPTGSLVIVSPCEYEDLQLGDIVTMNAGGIYLTHRIVGKYNPSDPENSILLPSDVSECEGEDWYELVKDRAVTDDTAYNNQTWWVTKGDNSETLDGALTDNIVGRVYDNHAFGWVGTTVRYIRANYMMIVVLVIIFIVFISFMEWLKNQLEEDDIEVYENDED